MLPWDGDRERSDRVLTEAIWGSLLARLAEHDPALVADQRPRFAADDGALLDAVRRATDEYGRVALILDGIDHITRIRASAANRDPSHTVVELLAGLAIPQGCVVIVLSQPGDHLAPLRDLGVVQYALPPMSPAELNELANRAGLLPDEIPASPSERGRYDEIAATLSERSGGNALYATYLCREALRASVGHVDAARALRTLPSFDGTLENYYTHLLHGLDSASWVADTLSLLEFSVTRTHLKEIYPQGAHRVDDALDVLKPVLIERAGQGGVRVYHESFSRFLRRAFERDPTAMRANLLEVVKWLSARGFFTDSLAFRFLIPTLLRAEGYQDAVKLVEPSFVATALASGFSPDAIVSNLAEVIVAAAKINEWPAVARCAELASAARAFEFERFESELVRFAEVPLSFLGPVAFSERLLFDGRTTMPARIGLQLCAVIDSAGHGAPWLEYMDAYLSESKRDNTSYGEDSSRDVDLAWLRGTLRTSFDPQSAESIEETRLWAVEFIGSRKLDALRTLQITWETLGSAESEALAERLSNGTFALALAGTR